MHGFCHIEMQAYGVKSRNLTNATKETNGITYEKIIPKGIRLR